MVMALVTSGPTVVGKRTMSHGRIAGADPIQVHFIAWKETRLRRIPAENDLLVWPTVKVLSSNRQLKHQCRMSTRRIQASSHTQHQLCSNTSSAKKQLDITA